MTQLYGEAKGGCVSNNFVRREEQNFLIMQLMRSLNYTIKKVTRL